MKIAPSSVAVGLTRCTRPKTSDDTTSETQLPSHSSTIRNSAPRKSNSSKTPELSASGIAGSRKVQAFQPAMR